MQPGGRSVVIQFLDRCDCLAGCLGRSRLWEHLSGEIARIAGCLEGVVGRAGIGVAQAHGSAVGVGPMDVADEISRQAADVAEGRRRAGFFDVHVKEITEQFDTGFREAAGLQKLGGRSLIVEQIRLITVEWLVKQGLAMAGCPSGEDGQAVGQAVEGIWAVGCVYCLTLHRTDDGWGPKFGGYIDDFTDEPHGLLPKGIVGGHQ